MGSSLLVRFTRTYLLRYGWWFLLGTLALYITNRMAIEIPLLIKRAIDTLQKTNGDMTSLRSTALMIVGLGLATILIRTISRLLFFTPGRHIEANLRQDCFEHLLALEPAYFDTHPIGDILSKLTNDVSAVRALAGYATLQSVNVVSGLGLGIYNMVKISPLAALYITLPMLLLFIAIQGGLRRVFHLMRQAQENLGDLSDHTLSSYNGIAILRSLNADTSFISTFQKKNERYQNTTLAQGKLRAIITPLLPLMGSASLCTLLYFGSTLVETRRLSVADLAALIGMIAVMLPALMSFGWLIQVVERGVAALERLYAILDTTPQDVLKTHCINPPYPPLIKGETISSLLEVKHASFAYPEENARMVLSDISFTLNRGQIIGVFGKTGAGKSTLFALITRLYTPKPNTIFVNEVDSVSLPLDVYRKNISLAPQRSFLFSESVTDNIQIGSDRTLSSSDLDTLIRLSALDGDLARFPHGLDTILGPRGITLSGGQRQRVSLARALASDAPILLLDDVLSAVDHVTEARLTTALYTRVRTQNQAMMIAAHRISALKAADLILVLEDGHITARGTHDALLLQSPLYRDTWKRQCLEDEETEVVS